jgi:hypothetical protein
MMLSSLARFALAASVFALLLEVGCKEHSDADKDEKKSSEAPSKKESKAVSCNLIKQESLCRQYGAPNIEAVGEKSLKELCDGMAGEFKSAPCPTEKRVGTCATPEGTKVFYREGPVAPSAEQAEKQCKQGVPAGEWKATAGS